jgi:hypothetical protein
MRRPYQCRAQGPPRAYGRTVAVRRLLGSFLAVLVAAVLVGAGMAVPAQAAGGRVWSRSATLYRNCFGHPFSYSLSGFADGWTLTVDLVSASGRVVDRVVVPSSEGASGRGAFRLCAGSVKPGQFTVRPRVGWPATTGRVAVSLAHSSLTLRRPRTTAQVAVSPRRPRRNAVVRVRATVLVARPYGYFPEAGAKVKVAVRRNGAWRRAAPARHTGAAGRTTFRIRWRWDRPHKVRVKVVRSGYHAQARSRAVMVRPRPAPGD